jgi:hypothetical protein
MSSSNAPTSARAGHALTSAPTGPCPTPCARLAPTAATMPAPRLQAASRGRGWFRRQASGTTMDAVQISPSAVNGSRRAVTPDSRASAPAWAGREGMRALAVQAESICSGRPGMAGMVAGWPASRVGG